MIRGAFENGEYVETELPGGTYKRMNLLNTY